MTFTLSLLVAPLVAEAQPTGKVYRIGWLTEGVRPVSPSFLEAMRVRGYVDGHNLFIERRHAETREQLPTLAAELVALKVDLIATSGTPATRAAQQATMTIPIVFGLSADPVQSGLVASWAQPGGNLTGIVSGLYDDKQLEILKAAVPGIVRVACLCPRNLGNPFSAQITDAARGLGLELLDIAVSEPNDFDRFFAEARRAGADAVFVCNTAWFLPHLTRLGELAAQSRLPAIGYNRRFTEAGGLLSYAREGERRTPHRCHIHRQASARGEARRLACAAAHAVRVGHQSQDCKSSRPHDSPDTAVSGGRGDQIGVLHDIRVGCGKGHPGCITMVSALRRGGHSPGG